MTYRLGKIRPVQLTTRTVQRERNHAEGPSLESTQQTNRAHLPASPGRVVAAAGTTLSGTRTRSRPTIRS